MEYVPFTDINDCRYRIHGAAIYGNMDPISIPPVMLAYIPAPWIRHGIDINGDFQGILIDNPYINRIDNYTIYTIH